MDWQNPTRDDWKPEHYLGLDHVSHYLVEIVQDHLPVFSSILEIGAGTGRNLHFLAKAGFYCRGIELSATTVELGKTLFDVEIDIGDCRELLRDIPDGEYDCVLTQSCLMHLPDPPLADIARIARHLIVTNEVEHETKLSDLGVTRWAREYAFPGWACVWKKYPTGVADITLATTRVFERMSPYEEEPGE